MSCSFMGMDKKLPLITDRVTGMCNLKQYSYWLWPFNPISKLENIHRCVEQTPFASTEITAQ